MYPELSYQIIGILFDVYNTLGYGHNERAYQRAVATALKSSGLKFMEQVYAPLVYRGTIIGRNYFDFLIGEKVVLEIKKVIGFQRIILINYCVILRPQKRILASSLILRRANSITNA